MPRVNFVKKARKAKPEHGIEVGDSYYWWAFAYGPKRYSKNAPRRQQLTQSGFLISVYDIEDNLQAIQPGCPKEDIQSVIDDIENLHSETEDSLSNMPEHLQDCSPAGELMTERLDYLDEWRGELQSELDGIENDNLTEEDVENLHQYCYNGN